MTRLANPALAALVLLFGPALVDAHGGVIGMNGDTPLSPPLSPPLTPHTSYHLSYLSQHLSPLILPGDISGATGSRNFATHKMKHGSLREWDPYSMNGVGGRVDQTDKAREEPSHPRVLSPAHRLTPHTPHTPHTLSSTSRVESPGSPHIAHST